MIPRPLSALPENRREAARFSVRALAICPACGGTRDEFEAIAIGNPFLADRLLLATLCPICGQWGLLNGECQLRKPVDFEANELLRDPRPTLIWTEWKTRTDAIREAEAKATPPSYLDDEPEPTLEVDPYRDL